ncbi:MAG: MarR family transcriptional regulator [Dehalococcoidia bacterium]
MGEREELIEELLELTEDLFAVLHPTLSLDKLASDITVAQLRVLIGLRTLGQSHMSAIANAAGVVPSTATGIVDNLVGKGLVSRKPDPNDRRRVVCRLSPEGEELVQGLWSWGRSQIGSLLESMPIEQLRNASEGARTLRDRVNFR